MLQVLVNISLEKFSIVEKEAWAMQKLFIKNEKRRKSIEKNGQVFEISKTMGT